MSVSRAVRLIAVLAAAAGLAASPAVAGAHASHARHHHHHHHHHSTIPQHNGGDHDSDNNGYTATKNGSTGSVLRPLRDGPDAKNPTPHHFGSAHVEGLHMANCDGSVHFMKSSISPQTWVALGTISGGEVISSDAW